MSCIYGIEQDCSECMMCQCHKQKRLTNAEKIRSMTNEELAESRIDSIGMYSYGKNRRGEMWVGDFKGIAHSKTEAMKLELEWLESEVSE